ncbi:MAG: response regulator, partial [Planctomycetes bacterium]|nr:response regulator [Planctomycetota bacterium]
VLLVDDNPDNVSIFVHMLEPLGIHVTVAGNGREAVYAVVGQIASKTPFEMILMDMQMPIMDGAEATRELRRRQVQTPVIALTAFAMAEDQERCREAGCDLFLTKPVLRSKLISALWEAMSLPGFKRMTSVARPPVAPPPAPAVPVTPPAPTGDFGELLQRYRVSLRRQLAQIESAQAAGASDDICKTAHRLKGTAANYGFPQITECAARCEDQLRQGATLQQISRDLAKLKASISAVVGNE